MHADTYYDLSFSGSVTGSGTMDLNPTADTITVTLTNTTNLNGSTQASDANLISGLIFTLNNAPTSAVSLGSASGALVNISATKDHSAVAVSDTTDTVDHWGTSNKNATICLEAAGQGSPDCAVGGQPDDLILTNEANYYVNSSVTGHDPSILGTGTFVINVPGLNADSTVLSNKVLVVFGTGGDTESVTLKPGTPPAAAPEPASLLLVGSGLLGAAAALRRRMRA
jgi:hypothetical protein